MNKALIRALKQLNSAHDALVLAQEAITEAHGNDAYVDEDLQTARFRIQQAAENAKQAIKYVKANTETVEEYEQI